MREIKFRAWDEINKVMHYNFQWISSGDKGNDWIIFVSDKVPLQDPKTNPFDNPNPYFSQQFKKMQYIGIDDINKKEIYKGDIVKYENEFYQVVYDCKTLSFILKEANKQGWCLGGEGWRNVEVIGNIFENPELLLKR